MFLGSHFPRLDDKGRLILPARYREALADGLVITRGQERCLYVYAAADFARVNARVLAAPPTTRAARDFQRVLLSGASDEVPDRQGRITVPGVLRRYAGLERDCAVIGAGARLEVWDEPAWRSYLLEQEEEYSRSAHDVLAGPDGPPPP